MIRVGKGRGGLEIDPQKLVGGCALVQGTRGSGKSYLVRVIVEQVIPTGLQTLILDPEGEFSTLREKCDVLIAGPQGDVPCEVRSAKLLARKVAELGCSAVADISALAPAEQCDFVAAFLAALDRLPKSLEAPRLLVLDEAHRFCPESGKGRASSTEAVVLLMSQGRKRGLGGILVTQRLSKLRNDAAAEAANIFIGRTSPIDKARAQDLLGITKRDTASLQSLEAGSFFAVGPALSTTEVVRFTARAATTTHPEPGMRAQGKPKPPRGTMQKLIAELADLPPSVEEEEAASLEAANRRIADLERQVACGGARRAELEQLEAENSALRAWKRMAEETMRAALESAPSLAPRKAESPPPRRETPAKHPRTAPSKPATRAARETGLPTRIRQMLTALAQHGPLERSRIAMLIGMSQRGGGFSNYVSQGKVSGLWVTDGSRLEATPKGLEALGPYDPLPTGDALVDYWCTHDKVGGKAGRMLRLIVEAGERGVDRETLADAVDMSARGGGFSNYVSRLRSLGLISKHAPFVAHRDLRGGVG